MPLIRRDRLWKSIIEDCFEDVLLYFFPDMYPFVDLSRGFEFLDKELEQLFPESEGSERVADKLVKTHMKDGEEVWCLIHIEVQGYVDRHFPERMYEYFYRIRDRYRKPVTALALLTYAEAPPVPQRYEYDFFGTRLSYAYRSLRLMDRSAEEYAADGRLFGLVLAAARATLDRGLGDEALLMFVKNLSSSLLKAGFSKEQIRHVILFLQSYVRFGAPDLSTQFKVFSNQLIYKHKPMGIVELVREHLIEEAHEKGREEGRQEAREEVRQEVREEVRQEVREEVRQEVREEVRQEVREEVRQEVREEGRQEVLAAAAKAMLGVGMSEAQVLRALNIDRETLLRCLSTEDENK